MAAVIYYMILCVYGLHTVINAILWIEAQNVSLNCAKIVLEKLTNALNL